MSHGTYMHESWHMYAWVMAHKSRDMAPVWISNGTHMNESWITSAESWHTCGSVMSSYESPQNVCLFDRISSVYKGFFAKETYNFQEPTHCSHLIALSTTRTPISMGHVTHMNESSHTYQLAMALIRINHVTHVKESCHTNEWVIPHTRIRIFTCVTWCSWHESTTCMTRLIHLCDNTHSYVCHDPHVWHDSLIYVTWRTHKCDVTHHICDMTDSYVWQDSFICVTWLVRMRDMTHSYVWHDSFICVTWLVRMFDMTHLYEWHDSFTSVTWLFHMCDMTHAYV